MVVHKSGTDEPQSLLEVLLISGKPMGGWLKKRPPCSWENKFRLAATRMSQINLLYRVL